MTARIGNVDSGAAIGWKVCRRTKCLSCGAPVNQNASRIWYGLDFRLIELNIEKMEEEIENLNSTVEEHDGIIGKGLFFFQAISYFWQQSAKETEI